MSLAVTPLLSHLSWISLLSFLQEQPENEGNSQTSLNTLKSTCLITNPFYHFPFCSLTLAGDIVCSENKSNPSFLKDLSFATFTLITKSPATPPLSLAFPYTKSHEF